MSREKKPEEAKQATGGKARGCGKQELPTPVEFERELELWQLIRKCDKPGLMEREREGETKRLRDGETEREMV